MMLYILGYNLAVKEFKKQKLNNCNIKTVCLKVFNGKASKCQKFIVLLLNLMD